MWEAGNNSDLLLPDQFEYFRSLKGDLSQEEAQIELFKFLRSNIRVAAKLLLGFDLFPLQEIVMKTFFKKDFVLGVCTRGFSKTTLAGVFASLYAVMVPGTNILLIGPSFKQSKLIFEHCENFINSSGGVFFRECVDGRAARHENDQYVIKTLTGSKIAALPTGKGDKIRGYRANVVIIDEYREVPADIIKEVLKPFLIVNRDTRKFSRYREIEDKLIAQGKMLESQRFKAPQPKIIGLSSASYKVENLSKTFDIYLENILDPKKKSEASYAVIQISYRALQATSMKGHLNDGLLQEGRETMSQSQFAREYEAQFTDDSGSYFNMAQMEECTLKLGDLPTIQIKGKKNSRYILSIDPNYKENETSDHFAMCLLELSEDGRKAYVVHNYAVAGLTLKEHVTYLHYLLTNFNVVYIIGDGAGLSQVITFANDNDLFKGSKIELKTFEAAFDTPEEIMKAKQTYDKSNYRIVHVQNFTSGGWIQTANQLLQANFQHKRILFAANMDEAIYDQTVKNADIPIADIQFEGGSQYTNTQMDTKLIDLIDKQSQLIKLTKDECAMIEISITSQGHQSFDLPQNLRRVTGSKRPRKDSYTALLLGSWGMKCFNILLEAAPPSNNTFVPFMIG